MQPRPLYRWKSFWLGVLVLACLGWAWSHSLHRWTFLRFQRLALSHAGAGISLLHWAAGAPPTVPAEWRSSAIDTEGSWAWRHARFEAPETILRTDDPYQSLDYMDKTPMPDNEGTILTSRNSAALHFQILLWEGAPGSRGIFIPHWFLILFFLLPWTAFLAWRWRRMRSPA